MILSHNLPIQDVGILYSILSFFAIIAIYNDGGMTHALQYFLPKYWIHKQYDLFKTALITNA
jgi:hypothetical protein